MDLLVKLVAAEVIFNIFFFTFTHFIDNNLRNK